MANELQVRASLTVAKGGSSDGMAATFAATLAGSKWLHHRQSIGFAAEEALVLGEATGGGGLFFAVNRDSTNYVELRQATGAAAFAKLLPGECCLFRWAGAATAPFAIANTAAVELEYLTLIA